MDNKGTSEILEKIALLLSMKGANDFKIRAYQKAARIVRELPQPVEEIAERGQLTSIPGIGKGLAGEIENIILTGESSKLNNLLGEFPVSIFEIVEINGVGPKKAAFLYKEAGISSLEDFERAARGGVLRDFKGFGKKSEANIIEGIQIKKRAMEQRSLGVALPLAREIIDSLKTISSVANISDAGDLRRRTETVKDVPLIADSDKPGEVIESFTSLPCVSEVLEENSNSALVKTEDKLKISIRVVSPENFGASLALATGSGSHVKAVKDRITSSGYILDGDEIIDSVGNFVPVKTEEDFYRLASLPWIPPEVRETGREVEIYARREGPHLLSRRDLKGDLQMHTTYSDGASSISEMAKKAIKLEYSYIAVTDHSQSLKIAHGLREERMKFQHEEIDALNSEFGGKFKIFKSAEVDILSDGSLDYPDSILEKLDFVLVSIHTAMKMPEEKMTERVLKAVKHPLVHCLAHPSGRLIGRRPEFHLDWDRVFAAAAEVGIAIEINAHPSRLDLDETRCRRARDAGIPILINTDAHSPQQMDLIEYGVFVARRGWLRPGDVLNTMPLDKMEEWLKRKR